MTKRLGSLVGALLASTPLQFCDNFNRDSLDAVRIRDKIAASTGMAIGDTISLGFFRSTERFSPLSRIWWDAMGAGVSLSIGDANFPAGLAAAFSVAAANNGPLWATFTPLQMGIPLWQMLGYAADPGGQIELLALVVGAAIAANTAGGVAWQIHGHQ